MVFYFSGDFSGSMQRFEIPDLGGGMVLRSNACFSQCDRNGCGSRCGACQCVRLWKASIGVGLLPSWKLRVLN